jgi:hypothetical protein
MARRDDVEKLLTEHKTALEAYWAWDEKVKQLLKGRRTQDLTPADMAAYREAAAGRDEAYDRMRHLERQLLDSLPDERGA